MQVLGEGEMERRRRVNGEEICREERCVSGSLNRKGGYEGGIWGLVDMG